MSAPSFSSFPLSFATFPDLDAGTSRSATPKEKEKEKDEKSKKRREREEGDTRERKRRHEKRHKDAEEDKHKRSSRHREKHDDKSYGVLDDERLKAEEDSRELRQTGELGVHAATAPLYFTDRKGDQLNVRYGSIHAGDVPRYRYIGGGRSVLGLPAALKVLYRGRNGLEIGVGSRRRMPALADSKTRKLLTQAPTRRLISSTEDRYRYDEVEGFLRLPTGRKHKDEQSYRAITNAERDADSDMSMSSGSEAESSDDDSDTTPTTSLQATLKSLEAKLTANPSSVTTWLSLLSYTLSTVPLSSKNAPKARAEISLSILSRALAAHPTNARSRALRLRYLKAGEEAWHTSKLYTEWEDAVRVGGAELWVEWLDWRIRHAERGAEGVVEDAKRMLDALGSGEQDELAKLRGFWRAAVALRDAGYVERATALFQAQAELIYNVPPSLATSSLKAQLDALEEFWESENLRAGEPGARGWAAWLSSGSPDPDLFKLPTPPSDPQATDRDPFARWAALESAADRTQHLPTRTLSIPADSDSDPFSTILFSDLRPLLLGLRTSRAAHAFRLVWLAFLGLPLPGLAARLGAASDSTDDRWARTDLCLPARLAALFPEQAEEARRRIAADSVAGTLVGREREYRSAFGPVKSWGAGVLDVLDGVGEGAGAWRMWGREEASGADVGLVREVFARCRRQGLEDGEWDELALAFEAAVNMKSATKMSKSLLAFASDSLQRWATHARLERLRDHPNDARKVYQTVLTSSKVKRSSEGPLWWDWAEMEWLINRSDAAVEIAVRSTGGEGTGGIALLRAKRQLDELPSTLANAHWKEREAWIKLRVLLELLTAPLQSALSLLDGHLSARTPGSSEHESLAVASLKLLYYHGTVLRSPMPPAVLRARAEEGIERYPSNTAILGMFLEAEKGQGIWGRVRATLGETTAEGVAKEKDVARRVAEVWASGWEKGRWEAEQERTRSGLSGAVQDDRTRGSAVLWRVFVEFEIRMGELERAKKLLYRAVGECPLAKELYLLAFGPLRKVFSGRELREWANTMAERGVRMRRGLDEMLEGWSEGRVERGQEPGSEDNADSELEESAREYRRLLPY